MAFWSPASITDVNEGTTPNDGTGDSIRDAFLKVDDNFLAISNQLGNVSQDFLNANISTLLRATVANVGNLVIANVVTPSNVYGNINMFANIVPSAPNRYDLGSPDYPFKTLYVETTRSTNTISNEVDDPLYKINGNLIPGSEADVGIFAKFDYHPVHTSNGYAFFGLQHHTENFIYKITNTDVSLGNSVIYDGVYGNVHVGSALFSNTTPATSNVTGAVIISGGLGVGQDIHTVGNIYCEGFRVLNTADISTLGYSAFNGSDSIFLGNTVFATTTQSISTNTGAVVILGGLGVQANIVASGIVGDFFGNVRTEAQPYITSLGTLHSLSVANTTQTQDLQATTIGVNTVTASNVNTNTLFASSINTVGLVAAGNIVSYGISAHTVGNVGANLVGTTGYITNFNSNVTIINDLTASTVRSPNQNLNLIGNLDATGNVYANNVVVTNTTATFGDVDVKTGVFTVSADNTAMQFRSTAGLTDALSVASKSVNSFVQSAIHNPNSGTSASTDFIAYADTGDNVQGYIDMGIASSMFDDAAFGITKAGDGYIFLSAPAGTGGNLVLATEHGSYGDIVFAANGFVSGSEQGRFITNDGLSVTGNLIAQQGAIYQGVGAKNLINTANATATLSSTINSSVTTITVGSTTGFLVHGALYIDDELMYYTSKTSTQFTGITRGTSGTTAASHASGSLVYQPNSGLTNASTVLVGNEDSFVQVALKNLNSGASASTDMICYASNGDNDSGWIDMGITSETFNDTTYGVTGPDDGYIFMSAPAGTTGDGSLFLSTSRNGVSNDIVFSTNGFDVGNERMRIIGESRPGKPAGIEVYIPTTSVSTSTGALRVQGGVGIEGNLNVGGNFNLVGNISIGGTGSTTSTTTLVIENPINFLANSNPSNNQDIGFVGQYESGTTKYTGLIRQATTGAFRFFDGLTTRPTTTVNWAGTTAGNVYAGQLMLANTTVSSSTTTGALVVAGGAGIGGKLYVGGEVTVTGSIVPTANLTYNLGAPSSWFNTFYGVASQAQYADLAEKYESDSEYQPGTVVVFGGEKEITTTTVFADASVAGVVSTNPAYLMNAVSTGLPVALRGRVPVQVVGPVQKGDLLVTSEKSGFACSVGKDRLYSVSVFAKSLVTDLSPGEKLIEAVIL
jgi:hypothetical protein